MDATLSSSFLTNAFHISPSISQSQPPKNIAIQSIVSNNTISHRDISTKSSPLNKIITRPPFGPCLDPESVLSNNYAPVEELPPTECVTIEGILPPCLNGAYIRNGPNPQHPPNPPYHLFDGDGMLHCLRISNGRATLCSRYVKTNKYLVEHEAGSPIFPNILTGLIVGLPKAVANGVVFMLRHLCGHYNALKGFGLANTSVGYFGNKLFALSESDLPYQICITPHGDVETIGRYDFDGKFSTLSNMTSHLKVDAQTGETFAFRFSSMLPFLTYFRFDINGTKQEEVPIKSLTRLAFFHDFAITKKFAVFADSQIGVSMNLMDLMGGEAVVGADRRKIPRIGVIPRYATDDSEMRWFDVPGFNNMHAINAWDEDDDDMVLIAPNITPVEHALERMDLVHTSVEKVRINLKSGQVTRSSMSRKRLDFGVVNPAFLGRKNRYGYLAVGNPKPSGFLKLEGFSGVVKLDWSSEEEREVGCRMFGEGCYGGEPFFVPRGNAEGEEDEDNGYLVTYVHDENSGESRFLVMDAKSSTLDIVAAVKLPQRVPYGFHGLFVKESDLDKL